MKTRVLPRLAAALVLAALPLTLTSADEPKKAEPAGTSALTDASLLEMLRNLGYEPQIGGQKKNIYWVTIDRENFRSVFSLALSTDGTVLWFGCDSPVIDRPEAIPQAALLRLLDESDNLGPVHFSYVRSTRRMRLNLPIDNRGITPALLRKSVDRFADEVRTTWPLWKMPTLQPIADSPAAREDRQALQGSWKAVEVEILGVKRTPEETAALGITFQFADTKCSMANQTTGSRKESLVRLDASQSPRQMDFTDFYTGATTDRAIYKIEGDTLTICYAENGSARPTAFASNAATKTSVVVLKR